MNPFYSIPAEASLVEEEFKAGFSKAEALIKPVIEWKFRDGILSVSVLLLFCFARYD